MIRVDLHVHTRSSPDSVLAPERLIARCVEAGIGCIAVTDHNSIDGALEVRDMAPFAVIVGEEIRSAGGEIIGLFLQEPIPRGLPPVETARRVKDQGGLVSVPHPFDRFRGNVIDRRVLDELLPYVDLMEAFNARNSLKADNRRAAEYARRHRLPVCASSDAHTAIEIGRTYVEMPEFDGTPEGLMGALSEGRLVERQTSPLIHVLTTLTKIRKRLFWGRRRGKAG